MHNQPIANQLIALTILPQATPLEEDALHEVNVSPEVRMQKSYVPTNTHLKGADTPVKVDVVTIGHTCIEEDCINLDLLGTQCFRS